MSLVVMRRQVINEIKQKTKGVVYWGSGEPKPDDAEALKKAKVPLYSWDQFVKLGTSKPADPIPPKETDTCTIMYTRYVALSPMLRMDAQIALLMGFEYHPAAVDGVPLQVPEKRLCSMSTFVGSSKKCLGVTRMSTVLLQRHHRRSEGRGDHAQEHRLGHRSGCTIYRGVSRRSVAFESAVACISSHAPQAAFQCSRQLTAMSNAICIQQQGAQWQIVV